MEIYYTVYKITNKINGRIYIGCHKTTDLEDGYMGSGTVLRRSIAKHGIENFKKTILEIFDNPVDMFNMEATIVDKEFTASTDTYNICEGGKGGFSYININKLSPGLDIIHSNNLQVGNAESHLVKVRNDPVYKREWIDKVRSGLSDSAFDPSTTFRGKHHTTESKLKIGQANRKLTGKRNGAFGTIWITDGSINQKLNSTDTIPTGWRRGRVMKSTNSEYR